LFSGSEIANKFSLGRDKSICIICYGLASFFKEKIVSSINKCEDFACCFDESLNVVTQQGQSDLILRFWDDQKQEVSTRYFNSTFLGRATASHLSTAFKSGLKELPLFKLLQMSMNGPSVNLKFYSELKGELSISPDDPGIIDNTGKLWSSRCEWSISNRSSRLSLES